MVGSLKQLFLCAALAAGVLVSCGKQYGIVDLKTEYLETPVGIDEAAPRFSWSMQDAGYGVEQVAYRVKVAKSEDGLSSGALVFDSGRIESDECIGIEYHGYDLEPRTRYYWNVTVWGNNGKEMTSRNTFFETGLMGKGFGKAMWIGSKNLNLSRYRAYFKIEADIAVEPGSSKAGFVFGAMSTSDYQQLTLDFSDGAQMVLSTVRNGVMTDIAREEVALTKGGPHHISIESDGPRGYTLHIEIDGHPVRNTHMPMPPAEMMEWGPRGPRDEYAFNLPSITDSDGRDVYGRLYSFGFHQSAGQNAAFSNISITEGYWKGLLYSDPSRHDVKGDGSVQLIYAADNVSAPMLRKTFNVTKKLASARLYASARGVYDFYINGQMVSNSWLNPGWTDYNKRIMYNTFDVTSLLAEGRNGIGAMLGTGWFSDMVGHNGEWHDQYGIRQSVIALLVLNYEDGTSESICTDNTWRCNDNGPVVENGLFNGEDYDARKETTGWSSGNFDDSLWDNVDIVDAPAQSIEIQGYVGLPIENRIILTAKSMHKFGDRYIYDFGQNIAGVERLVKMKGEAGQQISIRFAEMLFPDEVPEEPTERLDYEHLKGQMYLDNYRSALSTDHYTFKGDPKGETWNPRFTTHGFRYLSIDGLDEPLALEQVQALALESVGEQTSWFETSNPDINKLFSNIVWGERGNFLSVPTDCPQRDERLGWTGDAQVFARAATYNMLGTDQFYTRWFYTVRDDQDMDGGYASYFPELGMPPVGYDNHSQMKSGGWQEVGVIVPWQVYQQFGDKGFIARHYDSMARFMDYLDGHHKDYIQPAGGYGDWLAPASTNSMLSNTAYAAYAAWIMERIARDLGKDGDAAKYRAFYEATKAAFNREFVASDGMTVVPLNPRRGGQGMMGGLFGPGPGEQVVKEGKELVDTQTSYVLGLAFGLFDEQAKPLAVEHLLRKVEESEGKLTTGFIGTPYICNVLSENGHPEAAYRLFLQTEYPSWLFPVLQGGTTMWERWNSYTVKNGFGPSGMNSFNHYSYGAIEEWMMSHCLGIQRDEEHPGYKHFFLQPEMGYGLEYAHGGFRTMYGDIVSSWTQKGNSFIYEVTVPANTSATLILPDTCSIKVLKGEEGYADSELKSGEYLFEISY